MIASPQGDAHFYAAALASEAACDLIDILPDTDIVANLGILLEIQLDLFAHIIQGKHYGTDHLSHFLTYCQDMKKQAERLKEKLI